MFGNQGRPILLLCAFLCIGATCVPASASAQVVTFEAVGERALGMAGAFVGVADDATAVFWNPAGLVGGGPAGVTIGWHRLQFGKSDAPAMPGGRRQQATLTSLGTWPIGLSFGTMTVTEVAPSTTEISVFRARQYGVSLLQSVLPGLVVGSTVRLIRGGQETGPVGGPTLGIALSSGDELAQDTHTVLDLDVSVMASAPKVRIGVIVKNLRSPRFDLATDLSSPLPRQARIGLAVLPRDGVTLAMDVDLNTVDLTGGLRQECAVGGETSLGSRLSVRSGVRWSLKGARQLTGTFGASVRIRRALWLDGHLGQARHDEAREGGIALRAGF